MAKGYYLNGCTITGICWKVLDNYRDVFDPQLLLVESDSGTPATITTITSTTQSGIIQIFTSSTFSYVVHNDLKALLFVFKT